MSFIDLMADDFWSDADIVNRTESELAGQFPRIEILKRKVTGQILGAYTLTADEQAELGAYQVASFAAGQLADEAREDMARLYLAMQYERGELTDVGQDVLDLVAARAAHRNPPEPA